MCVRRRFRIIKAYKRPAGVASVLFALLVYCAAGQTPGQNTAGKTSPVGTPVTPSPFILDLEAPASGSPIVLTRTDNGGIAVSVLYTGAVGTNAQVRTSQFSSDVGSITVDLLSDCRNPASKQSQPATVAVSPGSTFAICLFADPLPTNAKYSGRLIISARGVPSMVRTISLTQPAPTLGTLVLDHSTVSRTLSRSWWPPTAAAGAQLNSSVTLREKTSNIALHGVSVRLEQVSSTPEGGFDLKNNVNFKLNDMQADDLDRFPPANRDITSRMIPRGGQSTVTMTLHNLRPGDYAAVLRFTADNTAADDAQKLQINVHVRDSVWWAVAWLIIALVISFIATKVLTSQRRRASLLQQIQSLQPQWFAALPPVPSVIWVRAVLHQAQRLSRRFWLTSPDLIEASVNKVRSVLGLLDSVRQVRQRLEAGLDWLAFRRATLALDRVLSRIGTASLDDATVRSINAELDAFNDWLTEDKFPSIFWRDIEPALQSLQNDVANGKVPHTAKKFINELGAEIAGALANPPTTRAEVAKVYQQYTKLRILWDQQEDLDALIGPAQHDLVEFFRLADDHEWKRLKNTQFAIRMPNVNDPDGLEAYDVLQFSIEAPDPILDRSYLFRHKIECQWTFGLVPAKTFVEKHGWKRDPATVQLTPVSLGPSVVQYFPRPGRLRVSAKLVYQNDSKEIEQVAGPDINVSSDFRAYKILAGAEVASWVIAAIVAVATGLTMFYYKGASWGTYQDYLTLLLWGIGVDQGKNFLQALQSYAR